MIEAFVLRKECVPIAFGSKTDASDPFVDQTSVLPSAYVIGVINPAWKCKIFKCSSASFQPCKDTLSSRLQQFELNRSAGFLLNDDRASGECFRR